MTLDQVFLALSVLRAEREPKMNKEQVVTDGQSDGHTNMVTPTHSFFLLYVNLEFSSESDLHTALSSLSAFPWLFLLSLVQNSEQTL